MICQYEYLNWLLNKVGIRDIESFHYLQIEIAPGSREITTFITNKGLFRYTRLMFGITCAPELFQKNMEQILCGCDGCVNFIDDILVFGATKEEHDGRLQKVKKRLREYEVTLNDLKCVYGVKEVEFLGHRLSETGVRPSMDKVNAVKQFREPSTAEEVRSFLGLVNFVGKFIPNLASIDYPLRTLTRKEEKFNWGTEQRLAFDELKRQITSDNVLGYYVVTDRTSVVADASPVGLGAVLIQFNQQGGGRIITYANKSLSSVERRYAQTEKEALALVWAVERFHYYLYGRKFELITDHKPLEVIFGPTSRPCLRIERWVLRLQSYQYRVIYKPGKSNIADPLSRLLSDLSTETPFDAHTEYYVDWIVSHAEPKALKLNEIEDETVKDESIQAVKRALSSNKWEDDASKPFKAFAIELCFAGNILLRGTKIVIPEKLRTRILELAHEGHPGMTKMKQRLRSKVWWPKIDPQTETFVKQCRGCALVAAPSKPEPMIRKKLPSEPWLHLAMDLCGPLPSGHNLLVIVDYYSRFIEVEVMTKTDSAEIIKRLDVIFARFGLPVSMTVDNGRQFVSEEFKRYCETNNIQMVNTIPYWPQQNGEVERQNRSILKALVISQSTKTDWRVELQKYLMAYRSTPHTVTGASPAMLMFGREMKDKLPNIHQPTEMDGEIRDRDMEKKLKGKEYGDSRRGARQNDIEEGDKVLAKRQIKENKLQSVFEPTEYVVLKRDGAEVTIESTETGKLYRRNVAHLQKIPSNASSGDVNEDSDSFLSTGPSISVTTSKRMTGQSSPPPALSKGQPIDQETEPATKRIRKAPQRYGEYVMGISPAETVIEEEQKK